MLGCQGKGQTVNLRPQCRWNIIYCKYCCILFGAVAAHVCVCVYGKVAPFSKQKQLRLDFNFLARHQFLFISFFFFIHTVYKFSECAPTTRERARVVDKFKSMSETDVRRSLHINYFFDRSKRAWIIDFNFNFYKNVHEKHVFHFWVFDFWLFVLLFLCEMNKFYSFF